MRNNNAKYSFNSLLDYMLNYEQFKIIMMHYGKYYCIAIADS